MTLKANRALALILATSVFLALLTACDSGSGGSSKEPTSEGSVSPRLTLEEFGAWCSKFEEMAEPETETYGEAVKFIEDIFDEAEGLNPPEVLEEYWQVYLEGFRIVRTVFSRHPDGDSVDISVLFGDSDYQANSSAQNAIEDGLPSGVRLHISDCF